MFHSIINNQRGQALVELAIIMPILLMLIFGITEFGRIYSSNLIINNAAREGARAAALGAPDEDIIIIINDRCTFLDTTQLNIEITPVPLERISGNPVSIDVEYPVKIYAPIISAITGDPYLVSAQVIMRVE
jgi:Flp pilus assembly protein TadG